MHSSVKGFAIDLFWLAHQKVVFVTSTLLLVVLVTMASRVVVVLLNPAVDLWLLRYVDGSLSLALWCGGVGATELSASCDQVDIALPSGLRPRLLNNPSQGHWCRELRHIHSPHPLNIPLKKKVLKMLGQ